MFQIYEQPNINKKYIIGVDTALGGGHDYSVIQVVRIDSIKSLEQVAIYRSNAIHPSDFAHVVVAISQYYRSMCIIENNADCGGILLTTLHDVLQF